MARRKGISSNKSRNHAVGPAPLPRAQNFLAAPSPAPPPPPPPPTNPAQANTQQNINNETDSRIFAAMPLTQEKPRYEYAFTNNNDHSYLHKKFKKMASTVPVCDDQSSESDSSLHRETPKPQTSTHTAISNRINAAGHPDIENNKIGTHSASAYTDKSFQYNVQTNYNDPNYVSNQDSTEISMPEDNVNKTEHNESDAPKDTSQSVAGGKYICPYCKLACAKPSVLQKHIRAHTNERPFPCGPCGFAFKTKSNLYKHRRSRTHAMRTQGENAPPLNEDEWSLESESDTSLPPTSMSETGSEGIVARLENSRASELSSPELSNERISPSIAKATNDSNKSKTIYKPKFHRASLYQDEEERSKKVLSSNPNFLNEHISKIISDNEAIVDVLETPLQKKYGKIKQIVENKHLALEENSYISEIKSEPGPLNLTKISNESELNRRKRCHSESFGQFDYQKNSLNTGRSIIKDLLLKTKTLSAHTEKYEGLDVVYPCSLCNVSFRSEEHLELHKMHYCTANNNSNVLPISSLSPKEVMRTMRADNILMRSNSINVTLRETQTPNNLLKVTTSTSKSPFSINKPDNIVIIKSESNDTIAPLPSPGPLLGNTRLVDTRMTTEYNRNKMENINRKHIHSPKRRLDAADAFSLRLDDGTQLFDSYSQSKIRCLENNPTALRSLEELSHSPIRPNSTSSLQMFGGEVRIIDNAGVTTTLRIEPTRQLSPMVPQNMSPSKHSHEAESSNIVRSGLHSGGTMVHNTPTHKESMSSPHPKTPHIMLSIAASIPTPNLTVTSLPTPNINHFQFPPIGPITAFNPLTLPPLSPSLSPNGATTILHGGKLIPHVPGIPGPITPTSFVMNAGLQIKYSQNSESSQSIKNQTHLDRIDNNFRQLTSSQRYDSKSTSTGTYNIIQAQSPSMKTVNNDMEFSNVILNKSNESKTPTTPVPRFKIRHAGEKTETFLNGTTLNFLKKGQSRQDESDRNNDDFCRKSSLNDLSKQDNKKSIKPSKEPEIRNFNFENLITKAEIYNNTSILQSTSDVEENTNSQEPLSISVHSFERSETSYFQKNASSKATKEETKSRFLRPSTLPLKPGTFTPKKHHGITPNANTMPLISPETPRPAKAYGQLYLNGNAYTYLGLKCSTKVFYCTLNRPQPTYVPNQVALSMYCNWQILTEQPPHPLGLSTGSHMSLYDSRHRPQNTTVANMKQDHVLTHSSQWNRNFKENKQRTLLVDSKREEEHRTSSAESSSGKAKELAGGFESNEEYTYVRGRGRGRYVCLECGIRCKKPSMLKKHIRTHTDVRPYTCKHCSFSFKTKGNLTKHMKSKAHYKKCWELGINPNEGADMDNGELNQGSGETDDDSDSDGDDGNEGETESSDTDSWKSRLPEHEAAHSLLSLSGSRHSTTATPGLLTSARPSTYPYAPTGTDEASLLGSTKLISSKSDSFRTAATETSMEVDNEPMDLSKAEIKTTVTVSEIQTARESSVLASLASNTAKLPLQQAQWSNGEPMLHAYLTEKALQDTKIKQSQFISSKLKKQELSKIVQQESSNVVLNSFGIHDSTPRTLMTPPADVVFSASIHKCKLSTVGTSSASVIKIPNVTSAHIMVNNVLTTNQLTTPVTSSETKKGVPFGSEPSTSTENAKFVASEYLKLARGKVDNFDSNTDKIDQQDNNKTNFNQIADETDNQDQNEIMESEIKHSEPYPIAGKVVIGAGGVAFKVVPKNKDYPSTSAYTPGRQTEDGRSVCVVCNKTFSKSSQLRLHINIHYMERPFRCSACAVSFRTRGHLQKHERSGSHHNKVSMTSTFGAATSSNPRPFRCSDCNIAFRIHGHLAKHLRSKMHVMRLECLSKLPFGTFAEIERAGVSLTDIDTTDCANSLASLQLLAQKLHEKDPTKLESWDPTMVPPLLPAGRESSDDEDGSLVMDSKLNENSEKDSSDVRTISNNEGKHKENLRVMYSATDT